MDQNISIGVKANTSSTEQGLGKLEQGTNRLAGAMKNFGAQTDAVAKHLKAVEGYASRLAKLRETIGKDYGVNVSDRQGASILAGFERARRGTSDHAARLGAFGSFEEWYSGHRGQFDRSRDAARHRDFIMRVSSRGAGVYLPAGGVGGGGGGIGGMVRSAAGNASERFSIGGMASGALSLGVAGLALAGIGGVMSILGQGVDYASRRATGTADLSRRTGVSYGGLLGQIGNAGAGLGVSAVEATGIAGILARASGTAGGGLDTLRTSIGMSRAFGTDTGTMANFFGTMNRFGMTGGENGDPHGEMLASVIANAIDKSKFIGAAEEIVKAIGEFTATTARSSLSLPNVLGFTGALTGLTSSGIAGLDPQGAQSLLSRVSSSISGGGSAGDAGKNFIYAALMKANPGLSPLGAQALWEGGAFATSHGIFHDPQSGMAKFLGKNNAMPDGSTSNLQTILPALLERYGGNKLMAANAASRLLGISMDQAGGLFSANLKNASPLGGGANAVDRVLNNPNPGDEVRNSMAGLQDAITALGEHLLGPLNTMRDAVVGIARYLGLSVATRGRDDAGGPGQGGVPAIGGAAASGIAGKVAALRGNTKYDALFAGAGAASGIDATLLKAVAIEESSLDPKAVSSAGAVGLMQLKPAAFAEGGGRGDRTNPAANASAGARYLAQMIRKAKGDTRKGLAMYHGGPNAVLGDADFAYADRVLAIDRGLSPFDAANGPVPGGAGSAGTVQLHATPLTVTIQNQQGQTLGTGTTDIIPFVKSQPAGGGAALQTH